MSVANWMLCGRMWATREKKELPRNSIQRSVLAFDNDRYGHSHTHRLPTTSHGALVQRSLNSCSTLSARRGNKKNAARGSQEPRATQVTSYWLARQPDRRVSSRPRRPIRFFNRAERAARNRDHEPGHQPRSWHAKTSNAFTPSPDDDRSKPYQRPTAAEPAQRGPTQRRSESHPCTRARRSHR